MTRIYERETDELFLRHMDKNSVLSKTFIDLVVPGSTSHPVEVQTQTRHRQHAGSIDIEIQLSCGTRILLENKIDAAYSVTRQGDSQPERYAASVAHLKAQGISAKSVLLAPDRYISASRFAASFDVRVSYEMLRNMLSGEDRALLEAAIAQAETPYEPEPNESSAEFFRGYEDFARRYFPALVIKPNPNGNGVRPTESRTIYFDVSHTLRKHDGIPRPRMSLQCRDSKAPSASVKIMIDRCGCFSSTLDSSPSLKEIGGYHRPACRSLGIVTDTPLLDTQLPFDAQVPAVEEGLEAALRLVGWWKGNRVTLEGWVAQIKRLSIKNR